MSYNSTKPSRQRVLIALRSFATVAAASRSIGVSPSTILRMTVNDTELTKAYTECRDGIVASRARLSADAEKRKRDSEQRVLSVREVERRKARLFAAIGADPRIAAAAIHKRMNHEIRQSKMADLEDALESVEEVQRTGKISKPIKRSVVDVWDRWCGNCKEHRVDDPCEVCGRHTILVKGEGGPTSREVAL